ncbi:MAG TPA: MBL fold metallo-hydrolase [Acidimicrobiia bacterium]|nr:MBL fold metallo-hydrolase [Acidimicrobiia bacterium]
MTVPPPQSLGHGIHLIPAPLPFKSPAWVNAYAIEDDVGLLLIDCGTDWEPGRIALRGGMESLGLDESAVHTLLVSHLHPDHVGMASRLVGELGCRFVMHERAAQLVPRYNDTPGYAERLKGIAHTHGVPDQVIEATTRANRPDYMPIIDPPDHLVADGDEISLGADRWLLVVHTPGHEPAHICLRDSRTNVLFSGDHVLPRISPVIMYDPDIGDPLGDYLASLRKLVAMEIGLTYPAHGTLIDQGDERARQILLHHDRRLRDMTDLVSSGETTAWNVMTQSFRPNLDPVGARLAFLETISHLEYLRIRGRVRDEQREGKTFYRV